MPRMPNTPKTTSVSVRTAGKPESRGGVGEHKFYDYKAQANCPLCIEDLDATDLQFSPCPCGYQVCLFCYEQLKLHCNSQCPGCRREYGTVVAGDKKASSAEAAQEADGWEASHSHSGLPPMGPRGPLRKSSDAMPVKRSMEEASSAALPSGATWGATSTSRRQSVEVGGHHSDSNQQQQQPPGATDESAWPTLASMSSGNQQLQQPSQSNHRQKLDEGGRRRNTHAHASANSSATSSMDADTFEQVKAKAAQQQQQQQHTKPPAGPPVRPGVHSPEGVSAPSQHASEAGGPQQQEGGAAPGKDAAAMLMALLQRKDNMPVARGTTQYGSVAGSQPGEQQAQFQAQPHRAAAPMAPYLPLQQQSTCSRGHYDVWAGTPGIDFNSPSSFSAIWQGVGVGQGQFLSPKHSQIQGQASFPQEFSFNGGGFPPAPRPVSSRPPPPGFGGPMTPPPGFAAPLDLAAGGPAQYRGTVPPGFGFSFNEGYNPLHNAGMPVYRPHLGAL
eukprot:gene1941-33352_t